MKSLIKRDNNGKLARYLDWDSSKLFPEMPAAQIYFPEMKVDENNSCISAKINIPGMKKENISVKLHNNILTISSAEKQEKEDKENGSYFSSSTYSSFSQSISLPNNVDKKNIKTNYKDGVLNIIIPKVQKLISARKK